MQRSGARRGGGEVAPGSLWPHRVTGARPPGAADEARVCLRRLREAADAQHPTPRADGLDSRSRLAPVSASGRTHVLLPPPHTPPTVKPTSPGESAFVSRHSERGSCARLPARPGSLRRAQTRDRAQIESKPCRGGYITRDDGELMGLI